MTARDEAINAMYDLPGPPPLFHKDFGRLIDAVPGPVLARLAIERGALESAGRDEWSVLYRLVKS